MRVSRLLPLAFAFGALAFPAQAPAAIPAGFMPCPEEKGFYCGRVVVPVDRSGATTALVGKSIPLNVMWKPATVANTDGALFALAGGPGQAATPFASTFELALAPALSTRDLVVFDQRGTGKSGFLDCRGAGSATTLAGFVTTCAQELGPARNFYSSKESAEDIEAIRQAIGVDKATIFGVSYGTYVAQVYARLFPTSAASLVLDSVVSPGGVDPFLRSNFAAISKVLEENCSRKLCRGITKNPFGDLRRVVKRIAKTPIDFVEYTGKPSALRVDESAMLDLMIETFSVDAVARARLPAALRSALAGDTYPLGRILGPPPASTSDSELSIALYMATSCSDTTFPWASSDPLPTRQSKVQSALAAIPASAFSPFSSGLALEISNIPLCVHWPASTVDSRVAAPAPDIPVLVLGGLEDGLTPLSDAITAAAQFPHASRVNVPFTGHSVISDIWPNADVCVKRAIDRFFTREQLPSCSFVKPFFRPTPIDPTSLRKVKPVRLSGAQGRVLGAVLGTLRDVTMTVFSLEESTGLRSGFFRGPPTGMRLRNVVYVPGVSVSGTVNLVSGVAKLKVSGKNGRGSLVVRRGRKITLVTGTLGPKRFRVRVQTHANDAKVAQYLPLLLGLAG